MRIRRQIERLVALPPGRGEELARRYARVTDWGRLFDEAFEQGVAGILTWQMATAEFALPREVRERVERRLALDRLWHRRWDTALRKILCAFRTAELRVVVLKGALLSERIYPQGSLRPTSDVDLLTTPADCSRTRQALEDIGYQLTAKPSDGHPLEPPVCTHHLRLHHPDGMWVELHYSPSSGFGTELDAEKMLARSIPHHTEDGECAWILAPEDEIVFLAVHLVRHRLTRLGWLYDIKLFVQAHPNLEWPKIVDRARALGVLDALSVATALLERHFPGTLSRGATQVLPRSLRIRLAAALASFATGSRFCSADAAIWVAVCRVLIDRAYRALLSDKVSVGGRFWLRSMSEASGKFGRRVGLSTGAQSRDSPPIRT